MAECSENGLELKGTDTIKSYDTHMLTAYVMKMNRARFKKLTGSADGFCRKHLLNTGILRARQEFRL